MNVLTSLMGCVRALIHTPGTTMFSRDHCAQPQLPVFGIASLLQTSWNVPGTHLMNALVRLCAITGVSVKLLSLS